MWVLGQARYRVRNWEVIQSSTCSGKCQEEREKGRGLYALDPSALAASWHRRGILDGVVIADLRVLRKPNFSRGGQVRHDKE